ncbi:porin family protein [bacterium]|nr:porin family protein [bacterium]
MMKLNRLFSAILLSFAVSVNIGFCIESASSKGEIEEEKVTSNLADDKIVELREELNKLEEMNKSQYQALLAELARIQQGQATSTGISDKEGPVLGGYGEHHMNGVEGNTGEFMDIHRFVLYIGYEFADWVQFHSELEVEHAFVAGGNGEVVLEQFYMDLLLNSSFNFRLGRVLTPLGIVNLYHEPPTFYSVERPAVDKVIIPSTWSSDGIGIFGQLHSSLRYQAYVVNGLDATGFNGSDGIRGGRMKERPGISNPSFTGRFDIAPGTLGILKSPVLGVAGFHGSGNNGNKGTVPDVESVVNMISVDLRTSISRLEIRGEVAYGSITEAELIGNGTPDALFGYYVEGAVEILPQSKKAGRLSQSSLYLFARLEDYNTQFSMPEGIEADKSKDRIDLTFGVSFMPTSKTALKADYQVLNDASDKDRPNQFNLGFGFMF